MKWATKTGSQANVYNGATYPACVGQNDNQESGAPHGGLQVPGFAGGV